MNTRYDVEELLNAEHIGDIGKKNENYQNNWRVFVGGLKLERKLTPHELQSFRTKHGLLQRDLATQSGYSVRSITRWETGKCPIPKQIEIFVKNFEKR